MQDSYAQAAPIEDAIFTESLPINSIAVINRLTELMKLNESNDIQTAAGSDPRIHRCMWLLNAQYKSPTGHINMMEWWKNLNDQKNEE